MDVEEAKEGKERRELIVEENWPRLPVTQSLTLLEGHFLKCQVCLHFAPHRQARTSKGNASIEANKTLRHCLPTVAAIAAATAAASEP
jgi:hypothetical protein